MGVPGNGEWVHHDALAQRKVSGWVLEFGSPVPIQHHAETADRFEICGRAGSINWWIWNRPGHTPAELASNARYIAIFDGRIDDRASIANALGLDREERPASIALAAFSRWGRSGLGNLIGEFALAILDQQNGDVWLGVDQGGVGEIVWWQPRDGCIVATSDPGLLRMLSGPLPVDQESVFLHLNGADLPHGRSICRGVGQLPPEYCAHSRGDWPSLVKHPLKTTNTSDIVLKLDDAVAAMAAALHAAAKDRLRSGPGILLLSGGVDSGTVAAAARNSTGPNLLAAIAFASQLPGVDEQASSKPLADRLGLKHLALNVDELAPYSCNDELGNWEDRPGAPGPFDPIRLPFGEAIEASYALAARMGAAVVWSGDRGDLVIGERNHSALRALLTGIAHGDRRLAQIGALDLWADFQHRGTKSLIDHLRPLILRFRPQAQPHSRPIQILREPSTPLPSPSAHIADPLARRWALWCTPFVDRNFRASSLLARRHGLRITDPWSDVRVISAACRISQALINPPGSANKQLGREVASNLLDGWQPHFCQNGIQELWLYGTRGPGATAIRNLAAEPKLENAGIDGNLLRRATESYLCGTLKHSGFLSPAWDLAWWYRAYY